MSVPIDKTKKRPLRQGSLLNQSIEQIQSNLSRKTWKEQSGIDIGLTPAIQRSIPGYKNPFLDLEGLQSEQDNELSVRFFLDVPPKKEPKYVNKNRLCYLYDQLNLRKPKIEAMKVEEPINKVFQILKPRLAEL